MDTKQALKLYIVLSRAYWAASELDKQEIRKHGLSQSEFGVLELLLHKGPQPIQQLARKILLTSGSMTYVVSQLEKRGLVRRTPDAKDRRIYYADLTVTGLALIQEIFPAHEAFIHRMMNVLSGEDAEKLTDQLRYLGLSIESNNKRRN